mmetsp:Transcript_15119/g.44732  ORF Transcript_15119/g.44732 Transcript_15119/m.44732 type:complete len:238 (-) Transcript_15119:769-1482(-)
MASRWRWRLCSRAFQAPWSSWRRDSCRECCAWICFSRTSAARSSSEIFESTSRRFLCCSMSLALPCSLRSAAARCLDSPWAWRCWSLSWSLAFCRSTSSAVSMTSEASLRLTAVLASLALICPTVSCHLLVCSATSSATARASCTLRLASSTTLVAVVATRAACSAASPSLRSCCRARCDSCISRRTRSGECTTWLWSLRISADALPRSRPASPSCSLSPALTFLSSWHCCRRLDCS